MTYNFEFLAIRVGGSKHLKMARRCLVPLQWALNSRREKRKRVNWFAHQHALIAGRKRDRMRKLYMAEIEARIRDIPVYTASGELLTVAFRDFESAEAFQRDLIRNSSPELLRTYLGICRDPLPHKIGRPAFIKKIKGYEFFLPPETS